MSYEETYYFRNVISAIRTKCSTRFLLKYRMQTSEKFQDNNRFDNNVNNKFTWNSRENFS